MARNADTQIRITEETWEELNQRKGPGDAFEDVIRSLLDEDSDTADADGKEIEDIMDAVKDHNIDDNSDDAEGSPDDINELTNDDVLEAGDH